MNARAAPAASAWRSHISFGITALLCLVAFAWIVTFGTFQFVAEDSFGIFYDHQAAAWLSGRWDVPEGALHGEAFVVNGKVYGYFGPTPALLRVPLVAMGIGFAATTRIWMLLHFASCLAAAYALLLCAFRWQDTNARTPAWAVVIFTATVGLGSTLFFLGSRAYVYHEAILCGAGFALWSVFCSLRFLPSPRSRWWIAALACGVLAVQARAPVGLFALAVLGVVGMYHAWREAKAKSSRGAARGAAIAGLSAVGLFSFNLVSYVKFGTFEGCPLRYNVQYTTEQLAVLDHRNFHFSNLGFNTDTYFRRPIFGLRNEFPYVYREFINRREYPESRIAYRDPVLAIPWSMPALFALGVVGSFLAFAVTPTARIALVVLWAAGVPTAIAMLTAVAVTHRYTADFTPFLIATAAFSLVATEILPRGLRWVTRSALTLAAVAGTAVTIAITLHNQGQEVWGVPEEVRANYAAMRRAVDRSVSSFGR